MTNNIAELNYESYDRQLDNFILMSEILATEQDYCSTQELSFDIISLQAKVERLCNLADMDYAMQLAQLKHSRLEINWHYYKLLEALLSNHIVPLLKNVVRNVHETGTFDGQKLQSQTPNMPSFLPRLAEQMDTVQEWSAMLNDFALVETLLKKSVNNTAFPSMNTPERLWRLIQFFAQFCYLFYHFHRVCLLCKKDVEEEDAGRLLTAMVQQYVESKEGSGELQRYETVMLYENDDKPLSSDQLKNARKSLLNNVPQAMQLSYIHHIHDINLLAQDLLCLEYDEASLYHFVEVIAKWQLLTTRINELEHPKLAAQQLYNEVFVETVHGEHIDLMKLKEGIARMLPHIKRKYHWFCVWSVLKHHNLLANTAFEPFARQMMHKDWFGSISQAKHFNGDTLRDYNGYFTNMDYTSWQRDEFLLYKERYNKTRWSDNLCTNLLCICEAMNEEFQSE